VARENAGGGDVSDYGTFLEQKSQLDGDAGFDPTFMPPQAFDFQRALIEWAVRRGRGALFADCGMGKTLAQIAWAENVRRKTDRPVLILTPLAVAPQTVIEGAKFGIEVVHSRDGAVSLGINVSNYERLHYFKPDDFGGVVCDESSILKSFDGVRRGEITEFMRRVEYRLLCTATAAPNDYIELGTSSEALGQLGRMDMLNRFFRNDQNTSDTTRKWSHQGGAGRDKWRFKGHAEEQFWRWVCSWARAVRKPSDLGFEDGAFVLPGLVEREHLVKARSAAPGMLFDLPAQGLWEEKQESRRTIQERCEMAAALVNGTGQPAVVWCHLNDEGNTLRRLIPDAREVSGVDSDEKKESAFVDFAAGRTRVIVTKPKIGALGLNWQHCAHVVYFPSHSYEQYYQGVRRCWRFGQEREVVVDIVTTKGGHEVMQSLKRKAKQADAMFSALVAEMNHSLSIQRSTEATREGKVPTWLSSIS